MVLLHPAVITCDQCPLSRPLQTSEGKTVVFFDLETTGLGRLPHEPLHMKCLSMILRGRGTLGSISICRLLVDTWECNSICVAYICPIVSHV